MKSTKPCVLTINGGSSSIKFASFEVGSSSVRALAGKIEGIGLPTGRFTVHGATDLDGFSQSVAVPDHKTAIELAMSLIEARLERRALLAVGHRIVHGGPNYWEPQPITPALLAELRRFTSFDPEHLPEEIRLIEELRRRFSDVKQIACFDTGFHHDLPREARLLPIPRRYEAQGIRRYGFHGLSYEFLMQELTRLAGAKTARARVILGHLGSGASLAAVRDGRSIDTTMALTPASGLLMSTRSGDVDPGLVPFLARRERMTPSQFGHLANFESGLLGVSETSSDMRELLARESDDVRAAEAVALFCYQTKKWIGAYAAALSGPRHAGLRRRDRRKRAADPLAHLRRARLPRHRAGRGAQRGNGERDLHRREPGHGARHSHRRRADDRTLRLSHSWAQR